MSMDFIDNSIERVFEYLHTHYLRVRDIVKSITERRATYDILPFKDLRTLDSLLLKNRIEGQTTKDYSRISAELLTVNHTYITIRITVPLWDVTPYRIYKFYAIPDLKYKLVPMLQETVAVVAPDNRQFAVLTEAQLAECLSDGCEKPPMTRQTQLSHCGAAQIIDKSTDACSWQHYVPEHYFAKTEHGFLYAVPHKYHATILCPKGVGYASSIRKTGYMDIPPGCVATLSSTETTHSIDIQGPKGILEVKEMVAHQVRVQETDGTLSPVSARTSDFYSLRIHVTDSLQQYEINSNAQRQENLIISIILGSIAVVVVSIGLFILTKRQRILESQIYQTYQPAINHTCLKYCCLWLPVYDSTRTRQLRIHIIIARRRTTRGRRQCRREPTLSCLPSKTTTNTSTCCSSHSSHLKNTLKREHVESHSSISKVIFVKLNLNDFPTKSSSI